MTCLQNGVRGDSHFQYAIYASLALGVMDAHDPGVTMQLLANVEYFFLGNYSQHE